MNRFIEYEYDLHLSVLSMKVGGWIYYIILLNI